MLSGRDRRLPEFLDESTGHGWSEQPVASRDGAHPVPDLLGLSARE
jgi:hypothetical protein